jgi:CRP/FNR family transcriptional regulator, nitrogen oxide reductase regulator
MVLSIEEALRSVALFRSLSPEDRGRVAQFATVRSYARGETVFAEGDASELVYTVLEGRVKIVKSVAGGREVILEIFGPGDPLGAVVAYEGRPYPAMAVALEDAACLVLRRSPFFELLERHPSLVRGFLLGLTQRIVELTRRIPEVAGGRVESRLALLFLKLAAKMGSPHANGTWIPMPLSRQDLADLTGTTVETAIRIMSRLGKQGVLRTEAEGFVVLDRAALEALSSG